MFSPNTHPKPKMHAVRPYLPVATMEQILAFRPDDALTHTKSPLVNALATVLYETKLLECTAIAGYLGLDSRKLSAAISIETGMKISEIVDAYRLAQLDAFLAEHPDHDYTTDELAAAIGYSSGESIARFIHTKTGRTVMGRRSNAGPDKFVKIRSKIRKEHRHFT